MNIAADLDVEDRSILGSLKRAALLRGDEPAVVFTNGGSHSATELLASSGRLAKSLAERGVTPGDRVALVMSNRVEFLWSFFGAAWLGACAAGLNVHLRGATMQHQLGLLDAAVVVCENETIEHIEAVFGNDPRIINVDTDPVFLELVEGGEDLPIASGHKSSPADLAMITYTSGTTGLSKGTMYSQSMAIHFSDGMDWMFGYTEHDVAYSCLPLYHANAVMNALLPTLRKGAKTVFAPRFSASEFWSDVEAHKATATAFLGSMVPIIMSEPPAEIDAHNSLRIAQAVPVPDEHFHTFQERFGLKLFSMYGMSDIGPLVGVPHDMEGRPGKAGIAHPDWELLLVDDDGHPVPDGQAGEMLARPTKFDIMQMGYWRNPEATLEAWRDLWFHTGDYVRRDTDGWFEFVDRKKDAMRRFGENISSFEVEMALLDHPAIAEAAVYAVPAEMSEDEVMASIILKPGYANVEDEILTHCEKELPYFAVPRYYRMVDGMEKTPTEKVRKDLLREIGVDNATWDAGPRGRSKKG